MLVKASLCSCDYVRPAVSADTLQCVVSVCDREGVTDNDRKKIGSGTNKEREE